MQNRNQVLQRAASDGAIKDYGGWRVSTKGKRFKIKNVRLFNVTELDGRFQTGRSTIMAGRLLQGAHHVAHIQCTLEVVKAMKGAPLILPCYSQCGTNVECARVAFDSTLPCWPPHCSLKPFLTGCYYCDCDVATVTRMIRL